MRLKNHIKLGKGVNQKLRGIGKLGWTESGKLMSTQRRMIATFTNDEAFEKRKKRQTIKHKCPVCKNKVKVVKGKFVKHGNSWFKLYKYRDNNWYVCSNSNKKVL